MSAVSTSSISFLRASPDATLAKNLVAARVAAGVTQMELANATGISRATIAQIETGYSDPRLSTIVELAKGLGLPAIFLLIGSAEVQAMAKLVVDQRNGGAGIDRRTIAQMNEHLQSGMLKDRMKVAAMGANAAKTISQAPVASITAAIFSAFAPGTGTEAGALIGDLLARS